MLGFFPRCYPDELLYSVFARYGDRVKYPTKKAILQELFGTTNATATITFPSRLDSIVSRLPPNSLLTADRLITQHTLLPFFSPFLPSKRIEQLRNAMRRAGGPTADMRSGVMASRIPIPSHLRFCPICKREDEALFGESYWHRLHQLPGVEVCLSHQVFLNSSSVATRVGRQSLLLVSAEQATLGTHIRRVCLPNKEHQTLLMLAQDAAWLLKQPNISVELDALYNRYLRLLKDRGLATYTGSIHVKKLLNEFSAYYSPALLKLLRCELRGGDVEKTNWLLRLVRPPKHAQHPLYHLLLIQFLGCTAEGFFQPPEALSSFGEGPWQCLNPAADHYKQPVIMECRLGKRLRYGKPIGRFSCRCGFAYARTGPDSSPEDKFHVGRIISFGQVWEDKLKHLWQDSSMSISEIGRRLGVDPLTVRRHAARLKLSLSRSDKRLKPLPRATLLEGKAVSAAWENKRHRCRSKWLSAMKQRREITLKVLRGKLPREYAWLQQHDSEWLKRHKPRPQRRALSTTSVDWKRRDADYAAAVRAAASRLKTASGRPVQVTRTAIGRALGAITLLRQKLDKMPLTAQVLSSVVETREQYAVRRVRWTADLFYQEDVLPREWQLMLRANVYSLREVSAVECVVEDALNMLKSKISQSQPRRATSFKRAMS